MSSTGRRGDGLAGLSDHGTGNSVATARDYPEIESMTPMEDLMAKWEESAGRFLFTVAVMAAIAFGVLTGCAVVICGVIYLLGWVF